MPGRSERARGKQRWLQGCRAAALVALAAILVVAGCNLNKDADSPTAPAQLTGQNPNEDAVFNGTIILSATNAESFADGITDFILNIFVRDDQNNPVQNGTLINVSTSLGTVRPPGADPATAGSFAQLAVFSGQLSIAVQSLFAGTATVNAWIANVGVSARVLFKPTPLVAVASLVFRLGSEDVFNVLGPTPFAVGMVSTIVNSEGTALPGLDVNFRIIEDSTVGSGIGGAFFGGPDISKTDSSGEAFNTLNIEGVGHVTVVAEVIDPNYGDVAAASNQIIATTTVINEGTGLTLEFESSGEHFSEGVRLPLPKASWLRSPIA